MQHWTITEEAAALHKRFDDLKATGVGQAEFARKWSVPGGPSMVSQHIKGRRPIAIDAAIAYAAGFGCEVVDISPRLAGVLKKAIGNSSNASLANTQQAPEATKKVALSDDAMRLADFLDRITDDDQRFRAYCECMAIITVRLDRTEQSASHVPLAQRETSTEESRAPAAERKTASTAGTGHHAR